MRNKELKTIWKLAKIFWIISFVFWILETVIFLMIDGWHIKATNPIEINCDKIVVDGFKFAINLTLCVCGYYLMNLNKKLK